jgi:hypothetical protein
MLNIRLRPNVESVQHDEDDNDNEDSTDCCEQYPDEGGKDYREYFTAGFGGIHARCNELGNDSSEPVRWWTKVNEQNVTNAE